MIFNRRQPRERSYRPASVSSVASCSNLSYWAFLGVFAPLREPLIPSILSDLRVFRGSIYSFFAPWRLCVSPFIGSHSVSIYASTKFERSPIPQPPARRELIQQLERLHTNRPYFQYPPFPTRDQYDEKRE